MFNFFRIWSPTQQAIFLDIWHCFLSVYLSKISAYGRQAETKNDLAWTAVILDPLVGTTNYLHMWSPELCLASSKILTPTPLSTQRVCPPPAPNAGGAQSPGGEGGGGVNILEDARHRIGLLYSIISLRLALFTTILRPLCFFLVHLRST